MKQPLTDDDVSYPSFVESDQQRGFYDKLLNELTTGDDPMDITLAEFIIARDWPYLLGQLHLIRLPDTPNLPT